MTTLTDAQIWKYRKLSGDTDSNDESATDNEIDAYYLIAVTDAGTDTDTIDARTVVYLLRQRMGWAINQTDETGEFGNRRNSQIFNEIRDKLLPYWESLAGVASTSQGVLSVGSIGMGTDFTDDDWTSLEA